MMMRGLAATALLAMLSSAAWAQNDEFLSTCTAADKSELQVKVCTCMSGKVTSDRPAMIATMRMLNEAQAQGKEPDVTKMSPEEVARLGKVMETLAACFQ